MVVNDFTLHITGRPHDYGVRLEVLGEAESVDSIREMLRPILGNIRLTSSEVDADLAEGGSYEAHSLPTHT
jgi:hypothetical protein